MTLGLQSLQITWVRLFASNLGQPWDRNGIKTVDYEAAVARVRPPKRPW